MRVHFRDVRSRTLSLWHVACPTSAGFSFLALLLILHASYGLASGADSLTAEEVIRTLVKANAAKDMATMSRLMAHDEDTINYTIGGRKYVGWRDFANDMQHEFDSVTRLDIPIKELKVWTSGDMAWFAMELDYIRHLESARAGNHMILPLRETGVLEKRNGAWVLVAWHESLRSPTLIVAAASDEVDTQGPQVDPSSQEEAAANLSGEWEIQEEDRSYKATLDAKGNGAYTWQGGTITTTKFSDRQWEGTWHQPGNDREGGFEVLLSEDGAQAKGVWWYTRVGDKSNIPPRRWGGSYSWIRLTPVPSGR